jgi:predicted RNA methylase
VTEAPPKDTLAERVRSSGYTPRARDVEPLFELLAAGDDDVARDVERALVRAGRPALELAMARFDDAAPPLRARLSALVGRFATERAAGDQAAMFSWITARTADADPKTRRRAVAALGKLPPGAQEAVLLAALRADRGLPDARAIVFSLGNVGTSESLSALSSLPAGDAELDRRTAEARRKIEGRLLRDDDGAIDLTRSPAGPTPVLLHVRAGLELLLLNELDERGVDPDARVVGRGRVAMTLRGPLETAFAARTFLHLGFPLSLPLAPGEKGEPEGGDLVTQVVRALTSDAAWNIFRTFTRGAVRYRIEWADAGRNRARTAAVLNGVGAVRPELHNDSRQALWQVVVSERKGRAFVEIWPRVADPRFAYRSQTLPAASHPTIAAALARVAGVDPSDVVWDPFVGSGLELCERAILGPHGRMYGTDVNAAAIAAARENLRRAGAGDVELSVADARQAPLPPNLSLVLTNPPFGRRVLEGGEIAPLLSRVIERAARAMVPGGRLVWISPLADSTVKMAQDAGFRLQMRTPVDVGGIRAELQRFGAPTSKNSSPREHAMNVRRR